MFVAAAAVRVLELRRRHTFRLDKDRADGLTNSVSSFAGVLSLIARANLVDQQRHEAGARVVAEFVFRGLEKWCAFPSPGNLRPGITLEFTLKQSIATLGEAGVLEDLLKHRWRCIGRNARRLYQIARCLLLLVQLRGRCLWGRRNHCRCLLLLNDGAMLLLHSLLGNLAANRVLADPLLGGKLLLLGKLLAHELLRRLLLNRGRSRRLLHNHRLLLRLLLLLQLELLIRIGSLHPAGGFSSSFPVRASRTLIQDEAALASFHWPFFQNFLMAFSKL